MLSLHAPGGRAADRRHVFRLTSEKERTPMGTWNTRGLRGSTLEDFINHTNDSYREKHLALIQKIPTPITPSRSTRPAAILRWRILTRRARWTTSGRCRAFPGVFLTQRNARRGPFPLQNLHPHQIQFMKEFEEQGGIAFIILYFTGQDEMYYIPYRHIAAFWERMEAGGRKSFTYDEVDKSWKIRSHRDMLVHYLEMIARDLAERDGD